MSLTAPVAHSQTEATQALNARAKSLELNTQYVPPPGDTDGALRIRLRENHVLVRVHYRDSIRPSQPENVGYFTAPYAERAKLGTPKIDREKRTVEVTMPNGTGAHGEAGRQSGLRDAADREDRCVLQAVDREERAPGSEDATVAHGRSCCPAGDDAGGNRPIAGFRQAVETAFDPAGMTAAFVVTYRGRIIAERYGENITHDDAARELVDGKERDRNA